MVYFSKVLILLAIPRLLKSEDFDLDYFLNQNYNEASFKYSFLIFR